MIDLMSDDDIGYALELVEDNFALKLKRKGWEDIPEVDPEEGDLIFAENMSKKVADYGEHVTREELLENLGLSFDTKGEEV
jgi:hypothetical protein